MSSEFDSVEAELQDIEEAFATGRMNAFGSAATQDAFVQELKRIADIETQVFYRTCAILKTASSDEHAMVANMYASAQPPPQSQRDSVVSGGGSSGTPARGNGGPRASAGAAASARGGGVNGGRGSPSVGPTSPTPVPSSFNLRRGVNSARTLSPNITLPQEEKSSPLISVFDTMKAGNSISGVGGLSSEFPSMPPVAAQHIRKCDWENEDGLSDKTFDEVAEHFDRIEGQFSTLGEYLREISKHVMRLNDMSEQVNNANLNSTAGSPTQNTANSMSAPIATFRSVACRTDSRKAAGWSP